MHSKTALRCAAQNDNLERLKLLLRADADPSVRTTPHPTWTWLRSNARPAEHVESHELKNLQAKTKLFEKLALIIAASARGEQTNSRL
jgi:hypothetical protein